MLRRIFGVTVVGILLAAAWQQQALADWWFLRSYEPTQDVLLLAENSHFNQYGERLFYVSDPVINDKREFNENCPIFEKSYVLGCYSQRRIYVLDVNRPELSGVMEVTAAHEMLHAAYERLSARERARVVDLLEEAYADIDDDKLRSLIRSYEEVGGESVRHNELHSILPTQVVDLPPELEEYYSRYFSDRQAVAEMYVEYEAVFIELNREIDRMKNEVDTVRAQLNDLEQRIFSERARIDRLNQRLDEYEDDDDVEAYNRLVPQQNAAVDSYNALVDQYQVVLSRHNRLVDEVNRTVLLQNDLVNSMDSSFESL